MWTMFWFRVLFPESTVEQPHQGSGPQPIFEIRIQRRMNRTLLLGRPYPLGATVSSKGTNFAIFLQDATRVDLCLFDARDPTLADVKLIAEPWDVGDGGLSGRAIPCSLDRVEWLISRHDAPLLERRSQPTFRFR